MSGCDHFLEKLDSYLEGEATPIETVTIEEHLRSCATCRVTAGDLRQVLDDLRMVGETLRPDAHLEHELGTNPCRRWLGLLFSAVDREITPENLDRLLGHLDHCKPCRAAWQDLTLMHQVGAALTPPAHLLERCFRPRRARPRTTVLGRRFATAAAYVMAVLTSLAIGNPVTMARNDASTTVQRVTETFSAEISTVAEEGRGEARVMLWRVWQWTRETVDDLRSLAERLAPGDRDRRPEATQGE